jgi:hypothetical protein
VLVLRLKNTRTPPEKTLSGETHSGGALGLARPLRAPTNLVERYTQQQGPRLDELGLEDKKVKAD